MNYGQGNKLQDEINPTGRNNTYYSREDLEMLFWVGVIYLIIGLFSY